MNTRMTPLSSGLSTSLATGSSAQHATGRRLSSGTRLTPTAGPGLTQKFLTFCLEPIEYGIDIMRVREIIAPTDITPFPGRPACVPGIINLRGQIVPLIDLQKRLDLAPTPESDEACIIILKNTPQTVGLMVDRVSDVVGIPRYQIEAPPSYQSLGAERFLLGISHADQRLRLLLDVERLINLGDLPGGMATVAPAAATAAPLYL